METADTRPPVGFGKAPTGGRRGSLAEAARFWEPRRVIYNLILTAVAVFWVVKTWPHFRPAMRLDALLKLTVLALLANLCYCAAYVVDIAMQQSGPGAAYAASGGFLGPGVPQPGCRFGAGGYGQKEGASKAPPLHIIEKTSKER